MRPDLLILLLGEIQTLARATSSKRVLEHLQGGSKWLTDHRFATGWNYFLKYAIVLPNNLTAAGIIIQYWRPDLNVAIVVTTFTVAITAINVSRILNSSHRAMSIMLMITRI